jgi:hypothetical protein
VAGSTVMSIDSLDRKQELVKRKTQVIQMLNSSFQDEDDDEVMIESTKPIE